MTKDRAQKRKLQETNKKEAKKDSKRAQGGACGPELEAGPGVWQRPLWRQGPSLQEPVLEHLPLPSKHLPCHLFVLSDVSLHPLNTATPRQRPGHSQARCMPDQHLALGSLPYKHLAEHRLIHSGHVTEGTHFAVFMPSLSLPQTKCSAKAHPKTIIQHNQS